MYRMYRMYCSLFLIVLAGCATTQGPESVLEPVSEQQKLDNARSAAQEGESALIIGNLQEAQLKYALAVEQNPTNIEYQYKLGLVHYAQDSLTVAEGLLSRVLRNRSTHQGALETLGQIYVKQARMEEGESVLLKALEGRPNSINVLSALGVVNDMSSRHDEAKEYFTAALAADASSAKIHNNLGYSYYLSSDYQKAETSFRRAVALDPDYEQAWTNLGLILSRTGRVDAARIAFGRVQSEHEAANNIGYLALLDGDEILARREFNRAVNTSPTYYTVAADNLRSLDGEVRSNNLTKEERTSAVERPLSNSVTQSGVALTIVGLQDKGESKTPLLANSNNNDQRNPGTRVSVRFIQSALAFLGYDAGRVDGVIGEKTRSSIGSFQAKFNLESTGQSDSKTINKIKQESLLKAQQNLQMLGYDPGDVDGVEGRKTRSALRDFQRQEGITIDGKLGAEVFRKLIERIRDSARQLNSPDTLDLSARG